MPDIRGSLVSSIANAFQTTAGTRDECRVGVVDGALDNVLGSHQLQGSIPGAIFTMLWFR
jgi:hypothetical protein